MNKLWVAIIAMMGAFNVVYSIFIPIAVFALLIANFEFSTFNYYFLFIVAMISTLYRGVKFLIE